ncbi:hypothetical protein D3C75_748620 [compost metagenome]|jgi:hypothetical protein|uniref:DUF3304 domain-containing protein n=1 Tax=Silvania hatchlandensis TaxID=2926469 RepID=A0A9J6QAI7_9ENTR|nr:DUF3304 domain-containing protein [Silvania hatchlandensis]MCU6665461.1 DUF3304 domain-containing protein [Silvania hatchlandensis]
MQFLHSALVAVTLLLAGCDKPVTTDSPPFGGGGTIEAINHTSWAINRFSVNGVNGLDAIGPYQGGGGGCCFGVDRPWDPTMTVQVDWETGVAFASDVPEMPKPKEPDTTGMGRDARYKAWQDYSDKYHAWFDKFKAISKAHTRTVPLPDYTSQPTCGITVHFLPCDQIKVTTSCADYGNPDYPIKEPVYMEKPGVCPN